MKVKELIDKLLEYDMNDVICIKDSRLYIYRQSKYVQISPLEELIMKAYGYYVCRCNDKRIALKKDYLQFVSEYTNDFSK